MVEGSGFQVRIGERGGGVFQIGDRGGQVSVAGPMRIWTGPVREFSHRPYAAVNASCSAGVRSARLTVNTAAATASPPSPKPITPSLVTARYSGSSGAGGTPWRRASCGRSRRAGRGSRRER